MLLFLVFAPVVLGAIAAVVRDNERRPVALVVGGALHLVGTVVIWIRHPAPALSGFLALDAPGQIVLTTTSVLFMACAVYARGYLRRRSDLDNRVLVVGLLALLGAMTGVGAAQHLGLLWVAIEITTLSTAPIIYFNRNAQALEAAWKYLLVCSLGIALALLGTFFLAFSGAGPGGPRSLLLADLVRDGAVLSKPWVRAAFVFLLVGYGTKMGLAPLHSWKPDAYGEAPGLLGALLSGGVTSFAFLAIVRTYQVSRAAGEESFARDALVAIGLVSMAVAAVFMVKQRDFKRMLAWSSVEHMGILALGLGIGGVATTGAFFHSINNGLTKGVLFLAAGNIHRSYGTKLVDDVRGVARRLPISGPLFLAGFLAIAGTPPFSPFFSEFTILYGALAGGRFGVATFYLLFLAVVFIGMGGTVLKMVQGDPEGCPEHPGMKDGWLSAAPPFVLMAAVLLLGIFMPPRLKLLLDEAATLVVGSF